MIIEGDCLEVMKSFPDNHFSCIVTDSPYGISFMGKNWDRGLPSIEYWSEMLRIVKPGGHLIAAGLPRMMHRLICTIEDSGWEVRDLLMHIFGSGFPKSHNHFGIEGFGTALKPAWEGWSLCMKPCEGTFANNAEKWGQAGINIDACRIAHQEKCKVLKKQENINSIISQSGRFKDTMELKPSGRWPANVIFDEEAGKVLDEQTSTTLHLSGPSYRGDLSGSMFSGLGDASKGDRIDFTDTHSGASRFFYCAKASSSERGEFNKHPTVKPLKLMEYLIKLVMPPKDGVLLDPFAGSGSTIVAANRLGFKAIGIEKQTEYCEIARARLENCAKDKPETQLDLFNKTA